LVRRMRHGRHCGTHTGRKRCTVIQAIPGRGQRNRPEGPQGGAARAPYGHAGERAHAPLPRRGCCARPYPGVQSEPSQKTKPMIRACGARLLTYNSFRAESGESQDSCPHTRCVSRVPQERVQTMFRRWILAGSARSVFFGACAERGRGKLGRGERGGGARCEAGALGRPRRGRRRW